MAFKNSWIKCLIWLGFLFVNSAITTGLAYAGVLLGGVPTILLFAVACYAARSCCKAYDRKHAPLPSAADTGEEPKSASLADGAAAEEPAERQENREEAKMGEIIQLPKAKSVQPEQPVKENEPRRVSQKPVILTLSALVVVLTASCCLLGYHLQCVQESLLRATSAATPFRIRIHIHGINENLQIRNSGHEHVCEKQCIGMCSLARKAPHRRGAGLCLIAAAQAPPATRRHRRHLACASRRGG